MLEEACQKEISSISFLIICIIIIIINGCTDGCSGFVDLIINPTITFIDISDIVGQSLITNFSTVIIGCAIVVLYFGLTIGGVAFAAAELTFTLCDSCSWPSAAFMSLLAGWGCATLMRSWQHQHNFDDDGRW